MNEAFDTLRTAILSYVPMSATDLEGIAAHFEVRFFARNSFLLRKGQPCLFWGFVHEGLVRSYTIGRGGEEHTNWLIREGSFVTEYVSFLQRTPSQVTAHALEDTTLIVTDYERLQQLYERYQYLLDTQPDLLLRVPLKYIASWLGVTESSLSRIRQAGHFLPNGN